MIADQPQAATPDAGAVPPRGHRWLRWILTGGLALLAAGAIFYDTLASPEIKKFVATLPADRIYHLRP